MEYLPYIMLLQTLLLVVVEKFTFKIPVITQKVERFYKNIVEESLFGKDPDVAEVSVMHIIFDGVGSPFLYHLSWNCVIKGKLAQ